MSCIECCVKLSEDRPRLSPATGYGYRLVNPDLREDLSLKVLYRWQNPKFLTPDELSNPIPEWFSLEQDLKPLEKACVTKALGSALRAGLNSLGDLRSIDMSVLIGLIPNGSKNPVGQENARFLKILSSPEINPIV